jgi:hypothetical protein
VDENAKSAGFYSRSLLRHDSIYHTCYDLQNRLTGITGSTGQPASLLKNISMAEYEQDKLSPAD